MTRIGVSFDGFESTASALATAKAAMAAGASSLWMAEHMGYREAMVTSMGFRMNNGSAFVVPTAVSPYLWHPSPTAMSLATLAEVGDAPVGIAIGTGNPLFLKESGKEVVKPIRAVGEFVECLRQLWAGEGANFEGEFFSLAGARLGFTPPQPLVIYVAAMGPQMLALTGRVADGVVLSAGLSSVFCARSLAAVDAGAKKAGRDAASLHRAAYLLFAVSQDGRKAREIVRNKLAFLFRNRALAENIETTGVPVDQEKVIDAISRRDFDGAAALISDDAVDAYGIAGTPAESSPRIQSFVDAGVAEPVLMVQGDEAERGLALDVMRGWAA